MKQFTIVYDTEVITVREALSWNYIWTEIDPFCGRSSFRRQLTDGSHGL
jgi:hypothetical protein